MSERQQKRGGPPIWIFAIVAGIFIGLILNLILWLAPATQGPLSYHELSDARLRADARGGDAGIRRELVEGVAAPNARRSRGLLRRVTVDSLCLCPAPVAGHFFYPLSPAHGSAMSGAFS
jgi:hypothetical protein